MFHKSFSRSRFHHSNVRQDRGGGRGWQNRPARSSVAPFHYVNKAVKQPEIQHLQITHNFNDFRIDPRLKATIAARGYTIPTPIQDQAIPHLLEGKDVVGIANTGTGKTAAFLIPILNKILHNRAEKALIIVPTRELAVQVREEFISLSRNFGIFSVLCIGGTSMGGQIALLRQNHSVIIGTPGRLKDLIQQRVLRLETCRTIVLDEVDRMVDIGFIQDIRHIIALLPKTRQSLFFSATLSADLRGIIHSFLTNPVTVSVKVQETAAGIEQDVIRVNSKDEKLTKLHALLKQAEFKKVLIFGRTKWNVERLAKTLQQNGFLADSIHGNKSQNQRLRALSHFKQNRLKVLVATDIAARGLDIADVSHVINFDEPASYTDYIHRIGRTGRANKQGKALTFVM